MGGNFSCLDCCCGAAKSPKAYDPESGDGGLSARDIYVMLTNNQLSVESIQLFQALFFALWLALSFVPGFALYDGSPGHAHPVSHFGFWIIIEFAVIFVGRGSTGFKLSSPKDPNKLEYPIGKALTYLKFYIFMLIIGVLSNVAHAALSIVEIANCSSTLCVSHKGFLIATIAGLFALAFVIEIWLLLRVWVYQKNLGYSNMAAPSTFDVSPRQQKASRGSRPSGSDMLPSEYNKPPPPLTDTTTLETSINTPLLGALLKKKNQRDRNGFRKVE